MQITDYPDDAPELSRFVESRLAAMGLSCTVRTQREHWDTQIRASCGGVTKSILLDPIRSIADAEKEITTQVNVLGLALQRDLHA